MTFSGVDFPRRRFLQLSAGAVMLPAASRIAMADTYPSRPVHFIVPQAAASSSDITARLIGDWLSSHLNQQFVVDDKPGVGGNIGTEAVVRSPADGYTLLLVNSQNAISPALYPNLSFNFIRDIAPVAQVNLVPLVMEVNPSVPAKTVPEFIAYAKANPGKVNIGSQGVGSIGHLAGELFKSMTGIDMVHVPYRSVALALADVINAQMHVQFATSTDSIPQIRGGQVRALAVSSATRLPALPDVPTVAEYLPEYAFESWLGIAGPKNLPAEIVEVLNREINASLARSEIKAKYDDLGLRIRAGSPADFGKLIADDTEKWGKVIRAAGIKAE
jgi:tripartite-type tricarboxylate transporter receptor subunit TctC